MKAWIRILVVRKERKRQIQKVIRNEERLQMGTKWSEMLINSQLKKQNNNSTKTPYFWGSPVSTHSTPSGCCITWDTFLWALSCPVFYGSGYARLVYEFFLKSVTHLQRYPHCLVSHCLRWTICASKWPLPTGVLDTTPLPFSKISSSFMPSDNISRWLLPDLYLEPGSLSCITNLTCLPPLSK